MASSWMKDIQDRVKRASNDVNVALQPRVAQAKRSLEHSIQQIGLKPGREVYQDDERLLDSLLELDALRNMLYSLSTAVDQHRYRLLDVAKSQAAVAAILTSPTDKSLALLRKQLTPARVDAQLSLGSAEIYASNAASRFALDMSAPMADLSRTFEETYCDKISPLKKRYIAQKTEYLRFLRQAESAEDPLRKESLSSMAQSAAPMWRTTSDTLMAEIQSLVAHTTTHMSEWSLNVAQAEAETYSRSAKAFEKPARDAESAQNASST